MREFRTALNDESHDDEPEPYEDPEDDEPADESPKKLEAPQQKAAQASANVSKIARFRGCSSKSCAPR